MCPTPKGDNEEKYLPNVWWVWEKQELTNAGDCTSSHYNNLEMACQNNSLG